MQSYSHFLIGILLAEWIETWHLMPSALAIGVIFGIAFLSHFPMDIIVKWTYHPPKPHPQDKFWVGYHIFVVVSSVVILIIFWSLWWVMLATSIVDIVDWLLLRGLLHRRPIFHPWLENIRDEKLKRFPGLYEVKAGSGRIFNYGFIDLGYCSHLIEKSQ